MDIAAAESNTDAGLFVVSDSWRSAHPGAHVGVLAMTHIQGEAPSSELEQTKSDLEAELRTRYAGMDRQALHALPVLKAYQEYYKRFGKTYHVQLQLESIVLKDKPIASGHGLVQAMFLAEVDNLLLTAGHDLGRVRRPLRLDVARGDETYVLLRGSLQTPKAGDMMIADAEGIISSIVHGPDQRTQITVATTAVVYTTYAPPGIPEGTIEKHLNDIERNVRLMAPEARLELSHTFGAA